MGGVEAIWKVMETFPKCLTIQVTACAALSNLIVCHLGKKKALESGQTIDLLLAAVKNHLVSFVLCERAVLALFHLIMDDILRTRLLLSSGGVAAAIKVREKWTNKGSGQRPAQNLMVLLLKELNTWK